MKKIMFKTILPLKNFFKLFIDKRLLKIMPVDIVFGLLIYLFFNLLSLFGEGIATTLNTAMLLNDITALSSVATKIFSLIFISLLFIILLYTLARIFIYWLIYKKYLGIKKYFIYFLFNIFSVAIVFFIIFIFGVIMKPLAIFILGWLVIIFSLYYTTKFEVHFLKDGNFKVGFKLKDVLYILLFIFVFFSMTAIFNFVGKIIFFSFDFGKNLLMLMALIYFMSWSRLFLVQRYNRVKDIKVVKNKKVKKDDAMNMKHNHHKSERDKKRYNRKDDFILDVK